MCPDLFLLNRFMTFEQRYITPIIFPLSKRQQPDERSEKQPKATNWSSTQQENPEPGDGLQLSP